MTALTGIIETALYTEDLERAAQFYKALFGLQTLVSDERLHALNVADRHVLLLFRRGGSTTPIQSPGGIIPPHDGSGPVHVAFSIPRESLPEWETRLRTLGIAIESRNAWPRGGVSLYFRDPDQNLVELVTPGVWIIY